MSARKLFKTVRIFILLMILLGVALGSWLTGKRSTEWQKPLWIAIYPINGDDKPGTQQYIDQLTIEDFLPISDFIAEEAQEYNLSIKQPFNIELAPQVKTHPPEPPDSSAIFEVMLWSLKLRYWAYQANTYQGPAPHIRVFVKYFSAAKNQVLAHSLGLQQGMLGVVNAFADKKMTASNGVVIIHEILHTLGASDKYDLSSGQPIYPHGFADANLDPLYPQEYAEIMAGKIPLSENKVAIPKGFYQVIIGKKTAAEINWLNTE